MGTKVINANRIISKPADSVSQDKAEKKSTKKDAGTQLQKAAGDLANNYYKIPIAIAISFLAYFITRNIIPDEKIAWYMVEIFAFIMSLLALWGMSSATDVQPKIGFSVFLFTLVLFMFFLIKGYNEHADVDKQHEAPNPTSSVPIRTVYFVGPCVELLHLQPGEVVRVITTPSIDGCGLFSMSSPTFSYQYKFDGQEGWANGGNGTVPYMRYPTYLLRSQSGDILQIKVL